MCYEGRRKSLFLFLPLTRLFYSLKTSNYYVKLNLNQAHFFFKNVNIRIEFHSGCFEAILVRFMDLPVLPLRSGSPQRNQNKFQSFNN